MCQAWNTLHKEIDMSNLDIWTDQLKQSHASNSCYPENTSAEEPLKGLRKFGPNNRQKENMLLFLFQCILAEAFYHFSPVIR